MMAGINILTSDNKKRGHERHIKNSLKKINENRNNFLFAH